MTLSKTFSLFVFTLDIHPLLLKKQMLKQGILLGNALWDFLSAYCLAFTVDYPVTYDNAQRKGIFADNQLWNSHNWSPFQADGHWIEHIASFHSNLWSKKGVICIQYI